MLQLSSTILSKMNSASVVCQILRTCTNGAKSAVSDDSALGNRNEIGKIKKYPEEPTSCCMSGCANCVWLAYAEELIAYFDDSGEMAREEVLKRVQDVNMRAFLLSELKFIRKKS